MRQHPHREDLLAFGMVEELGAIGTLDDARKHLEALTDVGVHSVGLLAGPDPDTTTAKIEVVERLRP